MVSAFFPFVPLTKPYEGGLQGVSTDVQTPSAAKSAASPLAKGDKQSSTRR